MKPGVARISAAQTRVDKSGSGDRSPISPIPRKSSGPPDWTIGLATASIVLAPYLTISMEFRKALVTQALLMLAIALVVLVVAFVKGGWLAQMMSAPKPIVFGLALYFFATLQGTAVGLVRGNDLKLIAGQTLSLGLLPLCAVAGLSLRTNKSWRAYSIGLVASVALASLFHLSCWVYYTAHGQALWRLFLGKNGGVVGASLLAILLALALAQERSFWLRRATGFAIVVIVLYILGTQVRSLWIAAFLGALFSCVLSRGLRGLASRAVWAPVAEVAIVLLAGLAAITCWWEWPRTNLLSYDQHFAGMSGPDSRVASEKARSGEARVISLKVSEAGREIPIATARAVAAPGDYRLRAWVKAESRGRCTLVLQWLDSTGAALGSTEAAMDATGDWVPIEVIASAPPGSKGCSLQASCDAQASGTWLLKSATLEQLGPHLVVMLRKEQKEWLQRLRSLLPWSNRGPPSTDSIYLRQQETRVLLEKFVSFSLAGKLLGQGLGAVFYLGDLGKWIYGTEGTETANYIHNFYVFLLVKLGVVGSLVLLAALAIWIRLTLQSALALPPGPGRAFLASAAAAWLAGCLWSVACPEILDFRIAPLWGLLIAVSSGSSVQETQGAPRCALLSRFDRERSVER